MNWQHWLAVLAECASQLSAKREEEKGECIVDKEEEIVGMTGQLSAGGGGEWGKGRKKLPHKTFQTS